ncbi:Uncharacterised protein [Mycobacterium tuberculosis]|nr:Uncharacterised protein [Mycobacterium tuberculosis]
MVSSVRTCCTPACALMTSSLVVTKNPGAQKPSIRTAPMNSTAITAITPPITATERFDP